MKKGVATYSNRKPRQRRQPAIRRPKKNRRQLPKWIPYGAVATFALALCLTINFRAFTELQREVDQNNGLNEQIERMTSDNLNLQEEIYYLQNDSSTIEREARKFGFRPAEREKKVSVPTDR